MASAAVTGARPDHHGWLTKQSAALLRLATPAGRKGRLARQRKFNAAVNSRDWLRDWRRRFFELRGDTLSFSKGEGSEPHGTIDLKTCLTVKSAGDKCGRKHAFEVATAQRVFFMCADSEKDKDEWIGAIGRAIVRFAASTGLGDHEDDDEDDDEEDDDVYGSNAGGDL
ncbi:PH1 [Symbiodinium sp. KB8]|nr:PH1 [Symbiodinium sp. KB8]